MRSRDWPLVLFTLAGQAAAGLALFLVLPFYAGGEAADAAARGGRLAAALAVLGLLVAAAAFSLFHLGRPVRAARAVANAGRSRLSREILAEIAFGALVAGLAAAEGAGAPAAARIAIAIPAAAAGAIFVLAMAGLYVLPTVPAWDSFRTVTAFAGSALALGVTTAALGSRSAAIRGSFGADLTRAAVPILGLALAAAALWTPGTGRHLLRLPPGPYPPPRGRALWFGLRIALLGLASILWALGAFGAPRGAIILLAAAWVAAVASEALGRALFYSLADGL